MLLPCPVRIYFGEISADRFVLSQVATTGGEVAAVSTPLLNANAIDISRDHSQQLVGSFVGTEREAPFWVVPLPAGSPRHLADVIAHDGAYSPDGRQLLFANGNFLFLAKSDGSEPRKLLTTPGFPFSPQIFPGRRAHSIHRTRHTAEHQLSLGSQSGWDRSSRGACRLVWSECGV